MDGTMHPGSHGADGFRADLRQSESRFMPLPGLTAPESASTFHMRLPAMLVTARPVADSPPDLTPAPDAPSSGAVSETMEDRSPEIPPVQPNPIMPRPTMAGASQLAEVRAAALAEGHALGRAEAEATLSAEREALSVQAKALASAMAQLATPPIAEVDALTNAIGHAVSRLASERAGLAIDGTPEAFARRIARMAERVAQGMRDVSIHLNPDDLEALRPVLSSVCPPDLATLANARLIPDAGICRGDAELRAPGMRLTDLMSDAHRLTEEHI